MRTKHGIMAAIAAFAATVAAVPLSVYAALPDGYAQLVWVESDGTAYINTGVVPTQTMEFTFKFQPETQQAWKGAFGSYVDESSLATRIIFENTSSTSFRVYHLSCAGAAGAGVYFGNVVSGLGQPIEGYFNHSYARLNNVEHSLSAVAGNATSAPMKLGRSSGACASRQKIFYFKITEGSTLLRDFVPARRESDSAIGFYDRANSVFYGNAESSGAFTAGPSLDGMATWDGGGADNSFATAANWEGDVLPDLANGSTILTFATGGSAAQVPVSGVFAGGISFDTANNFAFTAASGGTLSLGAGGITLANRAVPSGTTWRYHDLNLPVVLAADQTWDMSSVSAQRIRLTGNLGGAADKTLTVTGSGCLSIYSTNDFAGNVVLNGGRIISFSQLRPFGSAADGGEIVIDQSKGAKFDMMSAVIDKPIRITSTSSGNEDKFGAYGTSAITAPIYQASTNRFVVDMNYNDAYGLSTLTLSGGGTFSGPVWLYPVNQHLRTLVIEGAPIVHSAPGNKDMAFKFYGPAELHLKNQGNRMGIDLGANQLCTGNSLHCWTNNVLNYQSDIILGYGSTLDLHGTGQQVGDLQTEVSGRIRSDEPAMLLAYYDSGNGITWGVNAGIDGAVTFRKSGPTSLTINGTNTTTGALIAQNGPLVIGETGCWQSTDVRIGATDSNRHPSMRLTRSNTFANPTKTVLTMTTTTSGSFYTDAGSSREPELILDAGVNAVFKRVILNGRCLAPGTWGGSESSAEYKDATHFSGSGMITVLTGGGFFLIVR